MFSLCDKLLGDSYRLKAMRYYETYGGHHMQWHTDNKTDKGFAHIPGIIFIAYLEDVADGEFQYVRGSHAFSGTKSYNDYTDDFIEQNYAKDVVSFKGPKGTLVIYDTYGIHRARPVADASYVRKSLFFQVDADCRSAEPILLNSAFIGKLDDKTRTYLGFGLPAEYAVFPDTGLKDLPLKRLGGKAVGKWLLYRSARASYELLPRKAQMQVKSLVKRWLSRG
jgi:hypothetical protein